MYLLYIDMYYFKNIIVCILKYDIYEIKLYMIIGYEVSVQLWIVFIPSEFALLSSFTYGLDLSYNNLCMHLHPHQLFHPYQIVFPVLRRPTAGRDGADRVRGMRDLHGVVLPEQHGSARVGRVPGSYITFKLKS